MTRAAKPATAAESITIDNNLLEIVYADRVINAGFGPAVSRLTLAIENSPGNLVANKILVLPTPALLEAMTHLVNAFNANEELRNGMSEALDAFKAQLQGAGNAPTKPEPK